MTKPANTTVSPRPHRQNPARCHRSCGSATVNTGGVCVRCLNDTRKIALKLGDMSRITWHDRVFLYLQTTEARRAAERAAITNAQHLREILREEKLARSQQRRGGAVGPADGAALPLD